jgi:hypothetical protein
LTAIGFVTAAAALTATGPLPPCRPSAGAAVALCVPRSQPAVRMAAAAARTPLQIVQLAWRRLLPTRG